MLDKKYVVQYSIFYYIVRYQLDTKQVGINGLYSLKKVVKLLILNLSTHCDLTHTSTICSETVQSLHEN